MNLGSEVAGVVGGSVGVAGVVSSLDGLHIISTLLFKGIC